MYKQALETANSCELAMHYGVTSKPEGKHSGYGLTLARDIVLDNGGKIIIASQNEIIDSEEADSQNKLLRNPWPGTLILIEWRTDRPLRLKEVYDNWPMPEGYSHEDFEF